MDRNERKSAGIGTRAQRKEKPTDIKPLKKKNSVTSSTTKLDTVNEHVETAHFTTGANNNHVVLQPAENVRKTETPDFAPPRRKATSLGEIELRRGSLAWLRNRKSQNKLDKALQRRKEKVEDFETDGYAERLNDIALRTKTAPGHDKQRQHDAGHRLHAGGAHQGDGSPPSSEGVRGATSKRGPGGLPLPPQPDELTRKERFKQNLRIAVPHIGLVLLSVFYALAGGGIFLALEQPYDMKLRNQTFHQISQLKADIAQKLFILSQAGNMSEEEWMSYADKRFNEIIKNVYPDFTRNYMTPDDLINETLVQTVTKWNFMGSVFFSWTAITTIGYGHIVPRTMNGRIACLAYTLVGIPLVLVTIADMGRFLSTAIIWLNNHIVGTFEYVGRFIGRIHYFLTHCCSTRRNTGKNISDIDSTTSDDDTAAQADEVPGYGADRHPQGQTEFQSERRISVLFVLVIMLGYTAGGALLIRLWEPWSFFDAFYFCFVTVTTIGFGDIVPMNEPFMLCTLAYIVMGLVITTMCIDLVGSAYIRDIHYYGRTLGQSFMTFGGKVVHLGEVFGYVAFLQKNYGITPEQLERLANLPDNYLLECLIEGRNPDLTWLLDRPFIPYDIFYYKWIEQPRTLSLASEKHNFLASMESVACETGHLSAASTSRTFTPREYYNYLLAKFSKPVTSMPGDLTDNENDHVAVLTSSQPQGAELLLRQEMSQARQQMHHVADRHGRDGDDVTPRVHRARRMVRSETQDTHL